MEDIFSKLKIKKKISKKEKNISSVFFQLKFDTKGAYINVVNEKLESINNLNYRQYSGKIREIIKYIERSNEKDIYNIDWYENEDKSDNKVYLSENEYLLELLKNSNNFVHDNLKPIDFPENNAEIIVNLEEQKDGKGFESKIILKYKHLQIKLKELSIISENYIFHQNNIYTIQALGDKYSYLEMFETKVTEKDLEKFFSLVYSYFENTYLNYNEYTKIDGESRYSKPTLIFEKIDQDKSLHIRVTESVLEFDPAFLEQYDINKIATVNDLEKTIIVSEIINQDLYEHFNEITKLLNKYKKTLIKNNNYFTNDNVIIIEEDLARDFIHKELTNLITKFAVFGSENLISYNIRTVTPKLKLSLNHGINFFEGTADLEIEGQTISAFDAINLYRKNSYIPLNDGTNAIVNKSYIDKLTRILKKQKDNVKLSFFDLPMVEDMIDEKIYQESFKEYREIFLGFNNLNDSVVKMPKVNAELRNYQKQGYKWLKYLGEHSLGGCLADDMGLGKTLQAITLLSSIYPKEKLSSIIVMPKSLLFNWENEIKKFNPKITYYMYYGVTRDLELAKTHNIIFTTYAMLRNDIEKFKDEKFYYAILDESQNIKNITTQSSKAVMLIDAKQRLALSGTPIENNLGELYSLFRFLNPTMFGSLDDFNTNYLSPIQKDGNKEVMRELRKKIYPFILRRLKKDVLKDLPEKIEQTLFVDMSDEQRELYEQRRLFYYFNLKKQIQDNGIKKSQFFIFQAMTELRQIASTPEAKSNDKIISPKREMLIENILDVIANGHKVLIFANYLNAIDYISEDLEKNNIEHLIMTGSTRDRKELVEKFQNDSKYKAFVMTLKTGGIGLNLTAADYVFIFDPWWNKAVESQAIDRSHRIGQDKTVFSYKLITKNTIEEKILQLQEKKSELFDNIISNDDASLKSFDEDDLEFVLGS
ncbi:MAG: DEAD/DEAH box helicase [Candidatus Sericytochromatia bacterium]|nr:DEAD/DEAH box helicase [Candidatus Sericytochromatia bacterium]